MPVRLEVGEAVHPAEFQKCSHPFGVAVGMAGEADIRIERHQRLVHCRQRTHIHLTLLDMAAQSIYLVQTVGEVAVGAVGEVHPIHLDDIADKGDSLCVVLHIFLVIVKPYGEPFPEERPREEEGGVHVLHLRHHYDKVIDKPLVPAAPFPAPFRHCLVEHGEIEVRQYLRGEVPDGQTPVLWDVEEALVRWQMVEECGVAVYLAVVCRIVLYHLDEGGEHQVHIIALVFVIDELTECVYEDSLVNTHKEAHKVETPDISVCGVSLADGEDVQPYSLYSRLGAEPLAAVVAHIPLLHEPRLKKGIEFHHQPVVNDAVAEVGGKHLAELRACHAEAYRGGWLIDPTLHLCGKAEQIFLVVNSVSYAAVAAFLVSAAVVEGIKPSLFSFLIKCGTRTDC